MRILFVIDTYDTNNNGTSISAQRFAAELRRRGHDVRRSAGNRHRRQPSSSGNHTKIFSQRVLHTYFQPADKKAWFHVRYHFQGVAGGDTQGGAVG